MKTLVQLATMSALLAGCAPGSFTDRAATLSYVGGAAENTRGEKPSPAATERRAIVNYHSPLDADRDGMDRRTYRDSIVWKEVAADDESFHRFVRAVRSDRALMTLSTDSAVIFLNGLATVTGTAGEKAALAALSGGLLSTKGSFDKELFNLEAMAALLTRMKAARQAAFVPIEAGLAKDIQQYPLERAFRDLRTYVDAGSLISTIDAIAFDAGVVSQQATEASAAITRDTVYRDSRDTVDALRTRLKALGPNQALGMAFAMEKARAARPQALTDDLKSFDPADARFKSGANAKTFLLYWLEQEGGASSELGEWSEALKLAEKGTP